MGGVVYRFSPLDDQWELYDLTVDPVEADNRWDDPAPSTNCAAICGRGSNRAVPSPCPNATIRGRTPRGILAMADDTGASELQQLADSLITAIESVSAECRDTDDLEAALAAFRNSAVQFVPPYHRLQIDLEVTSLPPEPVLFVANHGFGGIFDLNVMAAMAALEDLELDRPVTFLTTSWPGRWASGPIIEHLRPGRPARRAPPKHSRTASTSWCFPAGISAPASRSCTETRSSSAAGAASRGWRSIKVPIVPIVTAGAGESALVLTDGKSLAKALRLDKVVADQGFTTDQRLALPWGSAWGSPGWRLTAAEQTADDGIAEMKPRRGEAAAAFADRVRAAMQDARPR